MPFDSCAPCVGPPVFITREPPHQVLECLKKPDPALQILRRCLGRVTQRQDKTGRPSFGALAKQVAEPPEASS